MDGFKKEVVRLTSLLEQALRSKTREGMSFQTTFMAQLSSTLATPSNPPNMGASRASPKPQCTAYFPPAQPLYPIRTPQAVDVTWEEPHKDKMVEEEGLEKWAALEERMGVFEENNVNDPVKAVEMCLVPNVIIPKKFRVPKFVKYTRFQCPITHLKAYCNKMVEVVHNKKLLIHFVKDSLSDVALAWYMQLGNTKVKG